MFYKSVFKVTDVSPLQYRYNQFKFQMSTTENIHRKVLTNNPLKTNFISNNPKNRPENQKRFSNISREKQTIQKNVARNSEQPDMQGSATIVPQKSSSRQHIYANQNTNHNNLGVNHANQISNHINQGSHMNQGPTYQMQRKQGLSYQPMNIKAKSPVQKSQMQQNIKPQPLLNNIQNIQTNQNKKTQINNFTTKTTDLKTQRQKSTKNYLKEEEKEQGKKKTMLMRQKSFVSNEEDDLTCNQEMDLPVRREHTRNLTTLNNKTYDEVQLNMQQNLNKTQKKHNNDKPTMILQKQKQKSQQPISLTSPLSKGSTFHQIINRQPPKVTVLSAEQQLRKFLLIENQININNQSDTIIRLENRQKQYTVQPNFIQQRQKNFNWFMRAVLMDWMGHVTYEFGLKRQTYYIALTLADIYLEKTNDLPKSEFQLIGAACMFISAKLEQFEALSSGDFSKSTDNRYSPNQIKQMQLKISQPANAIYVGQQIYGSLGQLYSTGSCDGTSIFPKSQTKILQKIGPIIMMQMLDCSILDVQTLQFPPKILVFSFIYLVLGKNYKQWPQKRIVQEFPRSSHYLVDPQGEPNQFNDLFHMFLLQSFAIDIIQLLPAIQYCSTYFTLQLNFDAPSYEPKNQDDSQTQMNLQEYQSYQTYNGKMIDLVKKRFRGVYL